MISYQSTKVPIYHFTNLPRYRPMVPIPADQILEDERKVSKPLLIPECCPGASPGTGMFYL